MLNSFHQLISVPSDGVNRVVHGGSDRIVLFKLGKSCIQPISITKCNVWITFGAPSFTRFTLEDRTLTNWRVGLNGKKVNETKLDLPIIQVFGYQVDLPEICNKLSAGSAIAE